MPKELNILLSLAYKILATSQTDYLHNVISVQSAGRSRSLSIVTVARPFVSSAFQITKSTLISSIVSYRIVSPYLWNQLPSSFRQPHSVHCPPCSPYPAHITTAYTNYICCAYQLITVTTFALTVYHCLDF